MEKRTFRHGTEWRNGGFYWEEAVVMAFASDTVRSAPHLTMTLAECHRRRKELSLQFIIYTDNHTAVYPAPQVKPGLTTDVSQSD